MDFRLLLLRLLLGPHVLSLNFRGNRLWNQHRGGPPHSSSEIRSRWDWALPAALSPASGGPRMWGGEAAAGLGAQRCGQCRCSDGPGGTLSCSRPSTAELGPQPGGHCVQHREGLPCRGRCWLSDRCERGVVSGASLRGMGGLLARGQVCGHRVCKSPGTGRGRGKDSGDTTGRDPGVAAGQGRRLFFRVSVWGWQGGDLKERLEGHDQEALCGEVCQARPEPAVRMPWGRRGWSLGGARRQVWAEQREGAERSLGAPVGRGGGRAGLC